jgi:hypothetical protein
MIPVCQTQTQPEGKALATEPASSARIQDRHSHISIRLQVRAHDKWEHLQALGWNAQGFNFYSPQPIAGPQLELKRGLTHFAGTVVWSAVGTDDAQVLETIVNELVYKRARDVVDVPGLQARLLKLIRMPGMVEQKRKVLASLGLDIGDAKMAGLVAKRKQERPLIQYGVQVQSEPWATLVAEALSMSSVLTSLDQWSKSLGKK